MKNLNLDLVKDLIQRQKEAELIEEAKKLYTTQKPHKQKRLRKKRPKQEHGDPYSR